jgi:TolB-like protein
MRRFLFDGHVLDIDRRELYQGIEPVVLAPLVFDLLTCLVMNRDRVVSKADLLDAVWSGRIVSESSLTSCIAAARRAIGDSGETQTLIRTIPRKGFRFIGAVREEGGAVRPKAPVTLSAATPSHEAAATEALPLPDKPSIAVLAFANLSSDPEQEYLSDGMADDIITDLAQDRSLFVIARNSSFTYKGRSVHMKQIARELGVRYVLEGSIRRDGGHIRVNAQLIEALTGNHLWASRYDRAVEAVFAVQDEITRAVAQAIHPAISHAERQRALQKPPESLSAWEAWHRSLWFLSQGDISGMRDFLERAMTLDPGFAPVHAMLAFLILAEVTRGIGPPMAESLKLAEAEARTAVALDPRSAIAHAMLAWTFGHQGDWAPALEEAEAAIMLSANDPWGYLSKGHNLMYSGRSTEAREPLATALRLDPRGPTALTVMHQRAVGCYFERDYVAAEAIARRAIRDFPENPRSRIVFAASLGQLGRSDETRTALEAAIAASPSIFKFITVVRPLYYRREDHEHLLDGLRKAGWTG